MRTARSGGTDCRFHRRAAGHDERPPRVAVDRSDLSASEDGVREVRVDDPPEIPVLRVESVSGCASG
jgi:hypothetical protein